MQSWRKAKPTEQASGGRIVRNKKALRYGTLKQSSIPARQNGSKHKTNRKPKTTKNKTKQKEKKKNPDRKKSLPGIRKSYGIILPTKSCKQEHLSTTMAAQALPCLGPSRGIECNEECANFDPSDENPHICVCGHAKNRHASCVVLSLEHRGQFSCFFWFLISSLIVIFPRFCCEYGLIHCRNFSLDFVCLAFVFYSAPQPASGMLFFFAFLELGCFTLLV